MRQKKKQKNILNLKEKYEAISAQIKLTYLIISCYNSSMGFKRKNTVDINIKLKFNYGAYDLPQRKVNMAEDFCEAVRNTLFDNLKPKLSESNDSVLEINQIYKPRI